MKPFVLFTACILTAHTACAQTQGSARLYGFKQPVSQGAFPSGTIDEQGRTTEETPTQRFNYLLYLASPATVYPSEVWVGGQPYSVTITRISSTPVTREAGVSDPDSVLVLVPKTSDKVIQLHLAPPVENKITSKGRSLAAGSELVVVYKSGGKFYYQTISKLTLLEPAAMQ